MCLSLCLFSREDFRALTLVVTVGGAHGLILIPVIMQSTQFEDIRKYKEKISAPILIHKKISSVSPLEEVKPQAGDEEEDDLHEKDSTSIRVKPQAVIDIPP